MSGLSPEQRVAEAAAAIADISTADKLKRLLDLSQELLKQCDDHSGIHGMNKLRKKCEAELRFLRGIDEAKSLTIEKTNTQEASAKESHLSSTNLLHLSGIVWSASTLPGVTHVVQPFSSSTSSSALVVDVVCNDGHSWIKVVARKAQALHLIWAGEGQFGSRSIVDQAIQYVECAKQHPKNYMTPQVVFLFCQGVTFPLKDELMKVGVLVQGQTEDVEQNVSDQLRGVYLSEAESEVDTMPVDEACWNPLDLELANPLTLATASSDIIHDHQHKSVKKSESGNRDGWRYMPYQFQIPRCVDDHTETGCSISAFDLASLKRKEESQRSARGICSSREDLSDNKPQSLPDRTFHPPDAGGVLITHSEPQTTTHQFYSQDHLTIISKNKSATHFKAPGGSIPVYSSTGVTRSYPDSYKYAVPRLNYYSQGGSSVPLRRSSAPFSPGDSGGALAEPFVLKASDDVPHYPESSIASLLRSDKEAACHEAGDSITMLVQQRVPEVKKLNLDISTLLCLVSNLCHGRSHLVFSEPILTEQAEAERKQPVLPQLLEFMKGKELYTCQSALEDFQGILNVVGGPEERKRAEELLNRVTVVPDSTDPQTETMGTSGKIKTRAKVIFGTGQSIKAITVTANSAFVRAAANQGVNYAVFVHDSRALTEQKEATATPLS